jgi:hypothetical protein
MKEEDANCEHANYEPWDVYRKNKWSCEGNSCEGKRVFSTYGADVGGI